MIEKNAQEATAILLWGSLEVPSWKGTISTFKGFRKPKICDSIFLSAK